MFTSRLKDLRSENKLTQKELAENLNLTHSTISKYERGDLEPSNDVLLSISDFFDVSVDFLLGKTNDRYFGTSLTRPKAIDAAEDLYRVDPDMLIQMCRATNLPEQERQKIKEYSALLIEKFLREKAEKEKNYD
ncbi:MAG: transcriptional regulator, family [Clostridia bacterium]|jgi:transcriptional regulator with XRE-family HTH domain|nr:transcriptional regulator, family [Clostridia bacterium]